MSRDYDLNLAKVAVGSIYVTVQNILCTIIGVFGLVFLARMVTQEEMGVVAGLTLLTTLTPLLSDFGLNSTIAKFVSELRGRKADISAHVISALSFRILVGFLLTLTLFALSPNLSLMLFETESYQTVVKIIVLDSFLLSISPFLSNVLLGLGELKVMALYGILTSVARWACVIVLLLNGYGLTGVAAGWMAGDLVSLLLYSTTVAKHVGPRMQTAREHAKLLSSLLKFSWPIHVSSMISFLYTWYDRVLILTFSTLSNLGVYNIAYQAFSVPSLIAASLGTALLPYYGMAYGTGDEETITLGIRRVSKYSMLTVSPLILGLAATAKPVITLFAGPQYEAGWPVLTILSLFGLVYGLSPAFSNLLLIYGKTKTILMLNMVSIALSLVFLPFLSTLGLEGFAAIKGFSFLFSFLFSLYFISKTVKVEIDGETMVKTLASSTVMVIVVVLVQELAYDKFFLPLYVFIGGVVYLAIVRALKILNSEDFQLLKEITGEKAAGYLGGILGLKP